MTVHCKYKYGQQLENILKLEDCFDVHDNALSISIYICPLKITYSNRGRVIFAQHYWSSGAWMGGRPTSYILFFLRYCILFTSFATIIWFSTLFTNMSFQCTSHATFPYALQVMRWSKVSSDSEHIRQRLFS